MTLYNYKYRIFNHIMALVFVLLSIPLKAQENIVIISSVDSVNLRLRWSPMNYHIWEFANKYGYTLQRYTIENQKNLILEHTDYYRPLSMIEWETIADTNDRAAIVAQAMFGDNFEITNEDTTVLQVTNIAKEQDMRFSFAMLMAAQDFDIACKMGLGTMQQIEPDKRYLYRLFINASDSIVNSDTCECTVTSNDKPQQPDTLELNATYINGRIELRWSKRINEDYFVGYHIERSSDSVNYKRINKALFVPFENDEFVCDYTFSDTVENIGERYFYRIQGVNFFGEYSRYSSIAVVTTYKPITARPHITEIEDVGAGNISVTWDFPIDEQQQLEGFQILVSDYVADNYRPMSNDLSLSDTRQQTVPSVGPANYVIVAAYDKSGIEYLSMPKFIQTTDSIAPMAPKGLSGNMNNEGVVTLDWTANTEPDIAGYRVFYTTDKYMEYTNLTNKTIADNHFEYKFPLNWLNRNLYFTIIAEDLFYNYSDFSDTITIKMFDTIPPSPAVFRSYESTDSAICLKWINSTSTDLMITSLVRYSKTMTDTLLQFREEKTEFFDKSAESDIEYIYQIVTKDSSYNVSKSAEISATGKHKAREVVLNASFSNDKGGVVLKWDNSGKEQVAVAIYKSSDGDKLNLYKTIYGNAEMFIDSNVELNRTYSYRIRIRYTNGKSVMSNTISLRI